MKKRRKKGKHRLRSFVFGVIGIGFALLLVAAGLFLLWASTLTLPSVDIVEAQRKQQSTKLYDRTGEVLLYDMHQDIRRTVVTLEDMSDHVKHATIAIEDDGFYDHFGIEPLAIIRAVVRNLQAGDLLGGQGGSTITQQVVKNILLVSDKKLSRKLKEWVLAVKLERQLTKDEILELYLNEVPYGGTKYGIEEASQGFFGKHASELTVAESAYLSALPQAPTYYSPYGNHRDALEERKNVVLARMFEQQYIDQETFEAALYEEVEFRPFTSASIKAPHFVFYVIDELQSMYEDMDIAQANLQIITTLDWELQKEAERIVYERAIDNAETFDAHNASLMAVDPRSGDILVMVGSRDYFDEEIDGNFNIGLAHRQPGSSFKPFAYAAAMQKGYTTETIVYDVRTQFSTACDKTDLTSEDGCYAPGNYDNKFRGPITFRNALAQSVNVPAVKAMYLAGLEDTYDVARRMGISTLLDYQRYGLTLVLGGGEVSLLEMTSAYGTFAHEGHRFPHTSILTVYEGSGKVLFSNDRVGEQVIDRDIALSITDVLSDNVSRTPAFGANSYLHFSGRDVAAKTGTTNDYRDAWIIGYTPTIAVGAWAGNNDNSEMDKKVAGFIIAPMWNEFMLAYFELYPDQVDFAAAPSVGVELKPILRGIAPGVQILPISTTTLEVVPQTTYSTAHSLLHWVYKDDPRGPIPTNPSADPQYAHWEYGVLLWRLAQGTLTLDEILEDGDEDEDEDLIPVRITEPDDNDSYRDTELIEVRVRVSDRYEISQVVYYLDGSRVSSHTSLDDRFTFTPNDLALEKGTHTLLVVVYDEEGGRGGESVEFQVD